MRLSLISVTLTNDNIYNFFVIYNESFRPLYIVNFFLKIKFEINEYAHFKGLIGKSI